MLPWTVALLLLAVFVLYLSLPWLWLWRRRRKRYKLKVYRRLCKRGGPIRSMSTAATTTNEDRCSRGDPAETTADAEPGNKRVAEGLKHSIERPAFDWDPLPFSWTLSHGLLSLLSICLLWTQMQFSLSLSLLMWIGLWCEFINFFGPLIELDHDLGWPIWFLSTLMRGVYFLLLERFARVTQPQHSQPNEKFERSRRSSRRRNARRRSEANPKPCALFHLFLDSSLKPCAAPPSLLGPPSESLAEVPQPLHRLYFRRRSYAMGDRVPLLPSTPLATPYKSSINMASQQVVRLSRSLMLLLLISVGMLHGCLAVSLLLSHQQMTPTIDLWNFLPFGLLMAFYLFLVLPFVLYALHQQHYLFLTALHHHLQHHHHHLHSPPFQQQQLQWTHSSPQLCIAMEHAQAQASVQQELWSLAGSTYLVLLISIGWWLSQPSSDWLGSIAGASPTQLMGWVMVAVPMLVVHSMTHWRYMFWPIDVPMQTSENRRPSIVLEEGLSVEVREEPEEEQEEQEAEGETLTTRFLLLISDAFRQTVSLFTFHHSITTTTTTTVSSESVELDVIAPAAEQLLVSSTTSSSSRPEPPALTASSPPRRPKQTMSGSASEEPTKENPTLIGKRPRRISTTFARRPPTPTTPTTPSSTATPVTTSPPAFFPSPTTTTTTLSSSKLRFKRPLPQTPSDLPEITFDYVMQTQSKREDFKKFCMREMSVENILFYEDWLRLKERTGQLTSPLTSPHTPSHPDSSSPAGAGILSTTGSMSSPATTSPSTSPTKRSLPHWKSARSPPPRTGSYTHAFEAMLHMYILPNSQLELNLLSSTRADIIQKMEAVKLGDTHALDVGLYDKVAEEVRQLMMTDTFPRYLKWCQQTSE